MTVTGIVCYGIEDTSKLVITIAKKQQLTIFYSAPTPNEIQIL